jgi:hypothetical protein
MADLELPVAETARRARLSEPQVRHWVKDRGSPDVTEVVQLAAALQVSPLELIYEDVVTDRSPMPDRTRKRIAALAEKIGRLVATDSARRREPTP